jgi:hypothetical protein
LGHRHDVRLWLRRAFGSRDAGACVARCFALAVDPGGPVYGIIEAMDRHGPRRGLAGLRWTPESGASFAWLTGLPDDPAVEPFIIDGASLGPPGTVTFPVRAFRTPPSGNGVDAGSFLVTLDGQKWAVRPGVSPPPRAISTEARNPDDRVQGTLDFRLRDEKKEHRQRLEHRGPDGQWIPVPLPPVFQGVSYVTQHGASDVWIKTASGAALRTIAPAETLVQTGRGGPTARVATRRGRLLRPSVRGPRREGRGERKGNGATRMQRASCAPGRSVSARWQSSHRRVTGEPLNEVVARRG